MAKGKFAVFNKYKIEGDTTILYLEKLDGRIFETLIDTEDLERIKALKYRWNQITAMTTNAKSSYAQCTVWYIGENGKKHSKTHFSQ